MNACLHGCMQCVDWLSQETHALPCQICELSPLPWHHLAKSEIKGIDWGKKSLTCVSWPSMVSPAPQQGLIVLSPWIATCMGSRSFSGMLGAHGSDLNVYYWSSVWQPYQQNRGALPVQVGPPAQSKILNPYTWCRLDRGTACMHACMISFQTKQPLQFAKKIWVTSWGSECKKEAHACSEMYEHIFNPTSQDVQVHATTYGIHTFQLHAWKIFTIKVDLSTNVTTCVVTTPLTICTLISMSHPTIKALHRQTQAQTKLVSTHIPNHACNDYFMSSCETI